MFDRDTYNEINKEEQGYTNWVREQKNRVLRMVNPVKKIEAWKKIFPKADYSTLTEEELNQPY